MEEENGKTATELAKQWEEMRTAVVLLREGKGRIVTIRSKGRTKKYVKLYED